MNVIIALKTGKWVSYPGHAYAYKFQDARVYCIHRTMKHVQHLDLIPYINGLTEEAAGNTEWDVVQELEEENTIESKQKVLAYAYENEHGCVYFYKKYIEPDVTRLKRCPELDIKGES